MVIVTEAYLAGVGLVLWGGSEDLTHVPGHDAPTLQEQSLVHAHKLIKTDACNKGEGRTYYTASDCEGVKLVVLQWW